MDSRTIEITPAAFKHGNLNIRPCGLDFFPKGILGGSTKTNLGTMIIIKAQGLPNPIKTDIPTDKKSGRPRWIFRKRSWVKKFIKVNRLEDGDNIIIRRTTPMRYIITLEKNFSDFITISEAARIFGKTIHNIRDYIQRERINKYNSSGQKISRASNGELRVSIKELKKFLDIIENDHKHHHVEGLHEELGFYGLPEYERTKHVHRLHPYLGKFVPQLVEW
jgi:hypothetical protein